MGLFRGILSVPHNIVMDMNDVMFSMKCSFILLFLFLFFRTQEALDQCPESFWAWSIKSLVI